MACPTGYTYRASSNSCFKSGKSNGISRGLAEDACSADKAHLVYIYSDAKNKDVLSFFTEVYPETGKSAVLFDNTNSIQ